MKSSDKKDIEKRQLNNFMQTLWPNKPFSFIDENREEPDFFIEFNNMKVGIEVREIIQQNLRKIDAYHESVINIAQKKFEETYKKRLTVYVDFRDHIKLKKPKLAEYLTDKICEIISDYESHSTFNLTVNYVNNNLPRLKLPYSKYIKTLIVKFNVKYEFPIWMKFHGYTVKRLTSDMLQKVIDKKNELYPNYKTNLLNRDVSQIWLLLIIDGRKEDSNFTLDYQDDIRKHKFHLNFDRVYLHNYYGSLNDEITLELKKKN